MTSLLLSSEMTLLLVFEVEIIIIIIAWDNYY